MKIKCPVCKSSIKFELGTDPDIKCSKCDTIYSRPKIEAALAKLKSDEAKTPAADEEENSDSKPIPDSGDLKAISPTHSTAQTRRKNKKAYLTTGLVIFCLAMASILFFVVKANVFPSLNEKVAEPDPIPIIEVAEEELNPSKEQLPGLSDVPDTPDWSKVPFGLLDHEPDNNPFAPIPNQFKSNKTMTDCWFVVKPYVLELQAETSTGPGFATGIIIDSRGWVLTSFRAVAGASTIHVRRARQTVTDQSDILNDTVRGYIAVDPEKDLVILSINRRLIDAFEDLPIHAEDALVKSEYVVQCQSPTLLFPQKTSECRVQKRPALNEFSELDQARLTRQKLDPNVRWIVHQQFSPLRYGAPLVNDAGSLVAMNTGFRTSNKLEVLAIPSSELLKFKKSASDTVKPLPVAGSEKIPVASNRVTNSDDLDSQTESDTDLVEKLSRLGKDCEIFGWLAQTENDEIAFREFIRTFVALKQILNDEQDSETFESIENQLADWQKKIETALGAEGKLSRDQQEAFNQKYGKIAKSNENAFIGFVYVNLRPSKVR